MTFGVNPVYFGGIYLNLYTLRCTISIIGETFSWNLNFEANNRRSSQRDEDGQTGQGGQAGPVGQGG